jgi:hypothetical protein
MNLDVQQQLERLRPLAQHPGLAEGQLRHRLTDPNLADYPAKAA